MLNDLAIEIADAIVDDLNAQLFSAQFTAERGYAVPIQLDRSSATVVTVVPRTLTAEQATRVHLQDAQGMGIFVRAKLPENTKEAVDPLFALAMEIRERYALHRVLAGRAVSFEPVNELLYDPATLFEEHQFTCEVALAFATMRQLDG